MLLKLLDKELPSEYVSTKELYKVILSSLFCFKCNIIGPGDTPSERPKQQKRREMVLKKLKQIMVEINYDF